MTTLRWLSVTLSLLVACGGDPTDDPMQGPGHSGHDDHNSSNHDPGAQPGKVQVTDLGSGVQRLVVDATDDAAWIEVDLALPGEAQSDGWDLRISRFRVRTNGGVSGDGGMEVAPLVGVGLAEVSKAPSDGYVTDAAKEGADPETPDFVPDQDVLGAFELENSASETGWYAYDPMNHVLSPADVTYAVRGRGGDYYALRFVDYYDAVGTPGFVTFDLTPIEAPDLDPLDALDASRTQFLTVDGQLVDDSDPLGWDLSISRTWMVTNSGMSGAGVGGARWAEDGADFERVTEAPTVGFLQDELMPLPGPPGSGEAPGNPVLNDAENGWYDYDPMTHQVSPKAGVILVRGADGGYAKVAVEAYSVGVYRLRIASIPAKPETAAAEVTLASTYTVVDLSTGRVTAEVEDPTAIQGWDLAFTADRVLTRAGAVALADFDGAATATTEGFVADEGVGEMRSHSEMTASLPSGGAFSMPVGDGLGYAKVRWTTADDTVSLEWVYTGPNRERFR